MSICVNSNTIVLSFDYSGVHSYGEPVECICREHHHRLSKHKEITDVVKQLVVPHKFSLLCFLRVAQLADFEVVILQETVQNMLLPCSDLQISTMSKGYGIEVSNVPRHNLEYVHVLSLVQDVH